jgi:acyl CoA:acetate/3-ketoacid CoA transferase beta subunit
LSDTLGVSMLVDAINHRLPSGATETTVFGPFYGAPCVTTCDKIRGTLTLIELVPGVSVQEVRAKTAARFVDGVSLEPVR